MVVMALRSALLLRSAAAVAAFMHQRCYRLPAAASTIGAALREATEMLETHGVPEASLSAEYLLARSMGLSNRASLGLHADVPLAHDVRSTFEEMCTQRLERVPVQYILGDWDFFDVTLKLRPPVLIPRPETEELVEHVLAAHGEVLDLLDVGCGSGAIGIALLHQLHAARCVGIDVSEAAVELARENAESCGVAERYRAELVRGGVAAYAPDRAFDVVVSNPPYIPRTDMAALEEEVRAYEDDGALCGGADGLDVIKDVLRAAPSLLRPSGPKTVWLEVDTSHPPLIGEWLARPAQAHLHMELTRSIDDLYGRPRFCRVQWRGPPPKRTAAGPAAEAAAATADGAGSQRTDASSALAAVARPAHGRVEAR